MFYTIYMLMEKSSMPVVSKVKKCCNEKVHMNNDMYMTEDLIPLIANKYQ